MDQGLPEVHLWRAVITQAIADATMPTRPKRAGKSPVDKEVATEITKSNSIERDKARSWLLSNSKDFRMVCEMALLDPDAVRESAQRLERQDWPRTRNVFEHRELV